MRMLRLGRGWTAQKLSYEYEKIGIGSLDRTTIAKIESGFRMIKAGEVLGVARAFGLTPSDLLAPDGPNIFLSYSDIDGKGEEFATWLADRGFQVLSAQRQEPNSEKSPSAKLHVIDGAEAFVALFSPNYLSSPRCREELDLAVRRKDQLRSAGIAAEFIYVMQISDAHELDTPDLDYPTTDFALVGGRNEEVALSNVGSRIIMGNRATLGSRDWR